MKRCFTVLWALICYPVFAAVDQPWNEVDSGASGPGLHSVALIVIGAILGAFASLLYRNIRTEVFIFGGALIGLVGEILIRVLR